MNIKRLKENAKALADNLQLYNGIRSCKVCGTDPEMQAEIMENDLKIKTKLIEKKIEGLMYNEELDREMRIVNMICRSAIKIVKKELDK